MAKKNKTQQKQQKEQTKGTNSEKRKTKMKTKIFRISKKEIHDAGANFQKGQCSFHDKKPLKITREKT